MSDEILGFDPWILLLVSDLVGDPIFLRRVVQVVTNVVMHATITW